MEGPGGFKEETPSDSRILSPAFTEEIYKWLQSTSRSHSSAAAMTELEGQVVQERLRNAALLRDGIRFLKCFLGNNLNFISS